MRVARSHIGLVSRTLVEPAREEARSDSRTERFEVGSRVEVMVVRRDCGWGGVGEEIFKELY